MLFFFVLFPHTESFIFPPFLDLIHILNPQLLLEIFHLYRVTHDFLHFFLSKFFFLDLKLVQTLVVRLEVHKFISYCMILSIFQGFKHLPLSLLMRLHVGYFPNAVFEDVVTFIVRFLERRVGLVLCRF